MFSTRVRTVGALVLILVSTWFATQFVLAEHESNIYVFPTMVTSLGWENETNALGQDLSPEAELADFSIDNSAYVFLGTPQSAESGTSTESAGESVREGEVVPALVPQAVDPLEGTLPSSVLPLNETPKEGSAESADPELPTPVIPGLFSPVPTSPSASDTPVLQSFDHPSVFSKFLHALVPHVVSAQDVISPREDDTSTSSMMLDQSFSADTGTTSEKEEVQNSVSEHHPTPMSSDPSTVLSCVTGGFTCRMMSFVGFGLGDSFSDQAFQKATLELSLSARATPDGGIPDRVIVRAFHAGRWEFVGDMEVDDEVSNGKRGGYLSYDLPSVQNWGDLSDLKIVVEYVHEGEIVTPSSVLLDGLWVNVTYISDTLTSASSPDDVSLMGTNVRSGLVAKDAEARKVRRDLLQTPDGAVHTFTNGSDYPDASIVLKTDKALYDSLGNSTAYFNVTNDGTSAEVVRLQFHFPASPDGTVNGQAVKLSRFERNVPYRVGSLKYDAIGYFCPSAWSVGSSTSATGSSASTTYQCVDTQEERVCDSLNEEGTNCIEEGTRVGLSEDVEYRDGWTALRLESGSYRDDVGLFRKALDLLLGKIPSDVIPPSEVPVSFLGDSVLLEPGQTMYFRAEIQTALNAHGEFYIEAGAESGAYGLVHAEWDGSWNYRLPISIDNTYTESEDSFTVPVDLSALPHSFWEHVQDSGADIRFVDSDASQQLSYWLASWDKQNEKGLAWVRVENSGNASTTRIFLYYGDVAAESASNAMDPFRTEELTPRALIFGKSQEDMTLHAIALTEDVRVSIGTHDPVLLKRGESALFDAVAPGMRVLADGPLALSLETFGEGGAVVPFGYAASHFVIPGVGGDGHMAVGAMSEGLTHGVVHDGEDEISIDPVSGSIVGSPVSFEHSVAFDTDHAVLLALASTEHAPVSALYPATDEALYGFGVGGSFVGFGENNGGMTALCSSSGARQEVDGRRAGATVVLDRCQRGVPELADGITVSKITTAVSAVNLLDQEWSSFLPESEFASSYVLSHDATDVAVLCPPASHELELGVFDSRGRLLATTTCASYGPRPGKSMIHSSRILPIGSEIRNTGTTSPFMAALVGEHSTENGTSVVLETLVGAPMMRALSPHHPQLVFGDESFVIPGEHRALDLDENGEEKVHVDKLLSVNREFTVQQEPGFQFQFISQSNSLMKSIRNAFGIAPFSVTKVSLRHPLFGETDTPYDIAYGDNSTWSLKLKNAKEQLHPGKYTLHVEIEEGGSTYTDEFDFYWGVLAINYNKSVFTPGETAHISIAALSDNGNTICDASLKLWVTPPGGQDIELPITPSGKCEGNNVTDVPDYTASYEFPSMNATGTYQMKLVRFDTNDNVASQIVDTVSVVESVPLSIEREGPTRIYPVAQYPMSITVTAHQDFEGDIVERIPGDFVVIDRGGADLEWGDDEHSFMTATWAVKMKEGQSVSFRYVFDAPDRSPFLFLIGPAKAEGIVSFTEDRAWQIASDAVGQTYIYWDQTWIPAGWNCVSCSSGQTFYQKFAQGSSTYSGGAGGGTATDTPTFTTTVYTTGSTGVGPATTNNTTNAPLAHTHGFTPTISGATNLPTYRQLVVLQWGSAGEPATFPTGAIVAFDVASSSLPSGWNRYTPLDGRYVRGMSTSTIGTTGGANTNTQTFSGNLSASTNSGLRSQAGVTNGAAAQSHTHTLTSTSTNSQNTEPPYVEVLFAKLTATATPPNTMIGMWDGTPPSGWITLSNPGGVFDGKFMKASTTYGNTGGAVFHTYNDVVGATTGGPSATANYNANASNAQAPAGHTHSVDFTGFSTDDTRPPYVDIIFAKRLVNVVFWTQNDFRFYANESANTPTDPWPTGGSDIGENSGIDQSTQVIQPGDVTRVRMNLLIDNATATPATQAFKMQYVASTDCVNALNWSDVAPVGSSTALWRGYDNSGIADGAALATVTLSTSNTAQSYVEANNSPANPATTTIGQAAEWDWVLEDHLAAPGTNYCFRMVKSDGTPLDVYANYPQALTNSAPDAGVLESPFDNEKVLKLKPDFNFHGVDNENNDLDYEIQIATNVNFTSPTVDADSSVNPEYFNNVPNPTNKAPFNAGDTIHFAPTSNLASSTTYWWRVRAKDAGGSNTWGSWSSARSFTTDTTVQTSTWFQTTRDQFLRDTLVGATTTGADDVQLISGSTTGALYGAAINFADATIGTAWGKMKWNSTQTNGTITYQLEYQDTTTGAWALVPDSSLAGNSTGFGGAVSSTSLLSVDASVYPVIRMRANLTNVTGTPVHLDWSLEWGYKVTTPNVTTPFDNAKVATVTPTFVFSSSDPQNDKIEYQISWSTTAAFTASTTRSSDVHAGFLDVTPPATSHPFDSGDSISFTVQPADALVNGTTYYYRIRARDPLGANDWSFWSTVRSITVDTSITVATWFQTDNDQFLTDRFTSVRTVSTGSTTVATSTDEAMFAYGEGTVQTPRYRIWSGSAWGTEQSALSIGATLRWAVLRASPLYGEYILATLGSDRDVNLQVYNNGTWGNMYKLTGTSPNIARRSFDVAYEKFSGRAIAVACTGTPDPEYAIWSSTSSSWVATGTINLASTNSCEWIRMASNPVSNEIVLVARDTGPNYEAQVWNATTSSWGNSTGVMGSMTEVGHEGMGVMYEASGDQAMVVVSDGNNSRFRWTAWRSSTASWSAATTQALGDDFENGNMARDPLSDNLNLCYIDQDNDVGAVRWTGSAWVAFTELTLVGVSKDDRPMSCVYESNTGRSGYIQEVYGDTTGTRYREWTGAAWAAQADVTGLTALSSYAAQLERTSLSGTLLGIFFVPLPTPSYYESHWTPTAWTNSAALETSASVTAAPYGQPFFLAPKNPATQGTIISTPISFADGAAPAWDTVTWSSTTPTGATFKVQVQYYNTASSTWSLIPDADLPGNSTGATSMSINIKPLNTDTYSMIRLVGNFSCYSGSCPTLNDWTVKWSAGLNISGTAKQHDLSTNVTSGTVAVAVNGVLQSGKTGTISGGVWTIPSVTIFPGNTVEVFTSGGATSTRAVGIVKYDGPGDLGGLSLNERWVTIGSASGTTPTAVSLTDLAKYDNSVSGSNDLFFDVVNASGDYNHCAVSGGCDDSSIYVLSGNTFRPATTSAKNISAFDVRIAGSLYADANTIKVGGSWRNLGGFTSGTGTVLFNATSSVRTIDSTGAATSTFANLTFGEVATNATWSFTTAVTATGTVSMNYGTTSPGAQILTLQGNLFIGANGTFAKGTATTTFSGTGSNTWTDNTASKQDLGNITINGSSKTVSLASSVKATHVNIASGNTLNGGGSYTMNVLGFWDNAGTFTPQSSTVNFATTTSGIRINQGTSAFYNVTFNGTGGTWSWLNTNATTTNDLTITAGTVTLPGGVLAIGGSFVNNGGSFTHNSGTVRMYSTLTGKSIRVNNSPFFDLTFDGSGGAWSFADTNATTSNNLTILAGTPTFPSGVFEIGKDLLNTGGSFVSNGGIVVMTSILTGRSITLSGSSLANLTIRNAGTFAITDSSATVTGDVNFLAGTTTLPSSTFSIGGSFTNGAIFVPGSGTVVFNTSSGSRTVNPGSTSFANVNIAGTGGSLTISANATTTGTFTLTSASNFTLSSGKTLAVGGAFSNQVGGSATIWTGSTLALNSGTNNTINTKSQGSDGYGTLRLGANTMIRAWNSSSTSYVIGSNASLYSQDHDAIDGSLHIFGAYTQSSGTDYWDYATDFDGTALGGSARQVNVRFDAGATATFGSGTTLEVVGSPSASTTIDRRSAGNYGISLTDATINANYYTVRNMNSSGLRLLGATTVTSLQHGDFSLDVTGGTSLEVAAATIDANPALQIFGVRFATSSGVASGSNVTETGSPLSYWRFKDHYGNFAGESHDNDPGPNSGNPGYVRWDDSSFVVTITGRVYADAGVTPMGAPTCDNVTPVVRVKVDGGGSYAGVCSSANGNYAVTGVTFSGDTSMTIYLDTNGGAQAALVTRSAAGDLAGMNLYQHRVIVRHEDVFPTTIANMAYYSRTQDTDIPFTAATGSPSTLTVSPDTEFWVWTGMTFVPGGNVTLQSGGSGATYDGTFHVDNGATFTAQGTENHSVGGTFIVDSGATFTPANSTFNFTATTSGKSITGVAPLSFWKMNFNGSGGNWSINQSLTVGSDFTVNAGTVSGASNVTVSGTTVTGSGTIAFTGGTFTLTNGGTFGGNTDWSFSSLTFGNGTSATTTKTGSSTVTVSGVLTASTAQTFQAGTSTTWILTGGGTPFVVSGALSVQNAIFRYAATGASANVTPETYAQLEFSATGTSAPTYTMLAGTFTIGGGLSVGNATGSLITLNANTNDPTIVASGDVSIRSGATFVASNSGLFTAGGNWTNQGTTTASGGTITFDALSTGKTIDPGTSPFANVIVNNTAGGWTITSNATATGAFTLSAANSFTLASGKTLEIDGLFTNGVGGTSTTWSGSTLYLNSGANQTINTKTLGDDQYGTLLLGGATQVRMWNSAAATTTVGASGSVYSMNHNNTSGSLYIYGNYNHTSGTDYWEYATDFDGATGTARQVNVRIASSSTLTFSGGGLSVLGTGSATTTIDVSGSGAYAFNVSGGTLGMRYYSLRNVDANGLNISGTPSVSDLSDGDFLLAVSGGTMMRVAGGTIDANPLLTFQRNRFATSSGVTSGYNVTAVGSSVSAWRFNLSYGNRSGEAYDNDPGGDPGYLIWDDSAAQLVISGNVYSDEGVTPIGAPTCDGVTQNVRLKVQGGGSYTSACNAGTGAYSISGVIFNPKDTITVYLDTNGGAKAVNVAYDPATNIGNMHLYQNRVILRHEQGSPVTISSMAKYDTTLDSDIPFTATTTGATSTVIAANTGLIVWNSKTFAPGGNVTVSANASGNTWDGTVHLYSTSTWSGASSETYTVGGHFLAEAAASITPGSSTFTFNATTSGKTIAASSSLTFYNLTFSGANGTWDLGGVGTTSNDLTISNGTTTLPSGTLIVGGSFVNTAGAFVANGGTVKMTSTGAGKTISSNGSSWNDIVFSGTGGGWTFTNTNATTTGSITILAGTPVLPSGVLAVGNSFDNQGGTFTAGSGTLKLTSTSTNRTIRLSGSSLGNLLVSGTGTFLFLDQNATTTGDITLSSGTTTFPFVNLAIGGSFTNSAVFSAGTSTVRFVATGAGKTINPGNSSFYNVTINGSGGGFTITQHATTTNDFAILAANSFTLTSGKTLAVGGVFTNILGGAATTWTGSTLALNSGTSFTINTKSQGADQYETIRLGTGTQARMWSSVATTTQTVLTSGLYSQNHNNVSGSLYIYGDYNLNSGSDYWSYAKDFDGTALGGSSRQVNVRFASNATATYAVGTSLEVVGSPTASTSIDRQSSGNYNVVLSSATINAQYYQFRNSGLSGLSLLGATTITNMNNGDFSLDISGGTSITIASTTIDQNASAQIFTVKFATSSGVTSGYNVTRTGTTTNAITFNSEYGNYAGEAYDNDGPDGCGSVRWSDSTCLISDQRAYRFRSDNGAEGAPSSEWFDQSWTKRKRVRVTNNSSSPVTDGAVKMTVVYDSDMQTSFGDLRFTDSSGTTSIPYWIEASTASTQATVWVKVPTLPASSYADVFMYFGNATATYSGAGTTTFAAFDDFEDGFSGYTGDTTLFAQSATIYKTNSYGLSASAGNSTSQNTDGIRKSSVTVGRDMTWHFWQYINMSTGGSDEPCFTFAAQSPVSSHQNYGVCLSPSGQDKVSIAKNVAYNSHNGGATELATTSVTYSTGWYEVFVDHLVASNRINVSVYTSGGSLFATTSATDSSYTSGSFGFSFWYQHGGWDDVWATSYNAATPSVSFGPKQADSGATWLAAENTYVANYPQNQNIRLRFSVRNSSLATLNDNFRLQVAAKLAAPNCESVSSGSFVDVPTTSGGCGSAAACMTTSPNFTNKASSTQHLSIPTGYTFTSGQIIEDPSNETDTIALPAAQVTEAEYNFQMTANAPLDRYCLRIINSTTPLDNYSRVAEIQVLHPPTISNLTFNGNSNIALTEGTTTTITATATVTDLNGYTDIVAASSTYYRSSVAGGSSCSSDNNNCYQIATSSCGLSNCSGNSCTISCSANMWYFADPTDVGSTFASDVWNAFMDVWDLSGAHNTSTANQELYTLSGLTVPSSISYGSVVVGQDTGGNNASTSVANTGNSILNLDLGGDFLKAGVNLISYNQQKYATSTFTYSGCAICNALAASSTPDYYPLGVAKGTTTSWVPYKYIYWGIGIPSGTAATTFFGQNNFGARQ